MSFQDFHDLQMILMPFAAIAAIVLGGWLGHLLAKADGLYGDQDKR